MLGIKILVCNEFLYCIDSDRLVDCTSCAGILAATIAHPSAHCREWILPLDKLQSLTIFSFRSFLQIALDGDVSRAGSLARRRTGRVAVDTVAVTIVLVPFVFPPFHCIREFLTRICLRTLFGAEFLTEFHGSCWAILDTSSAGDAFRRFHLGYICASGHIRCVEEL